ncbi:MAG: MFS transporter [Planctomycetia bacterium]|nr:MFS transporter [Planctomycetia bacterium]
MSNSPKTTKAPASSAHGAPLKTIAPWYRWELLVLLFLAYFFHQSDRAIFGVVSNSIKSTFQVSDSILYMTRTVMFALMALVVPLAGFLGDKINKRKLLILCLFCWSFATIATGMVHSVVGLIIFNSIGVSVAEAFYGPASTSLIAAYHKETRSIALSVHQTAVYLSVIFCGGVAAAISQHYNWRCAFFAFGGVSIIIGILLILRLKDPAKVQMADGSKLEIPKATEKPHVGEFLKMIFTNKSALLLTVGFTAIVFVNNAYLNVVSKFLQDKFGLSEASAGWNGMFWHHIAALICIYIGGAISDKFARSYPSVRPRLQFCAMTIGAPIVCLIGCVSTLWHVYALFFALGVCRGFYECNTHASIFETVPVKYRSTTVGFMIMFAFLIGSWSSQLVGILHDTYGIQLGYRYGFFMLGSTWVIGALCVGIAAFGTYKKDRERRLTTDNAA